MSPALQVFRKDVRRLRWSIAAWIAVVMGREILKIAGSGLSFDSLSYGSHCKRLPVAAADRAWRWRGRVRLVHGERWSAPTRSGDASDQNAGAGNESVVRGAFLVAAPMVGHAMALAVMSGNVRLAYARHPRYDT